jgi:serine/threonine protein kinase/TolB-like protein/Tfp pilus assembly protein PilF
MTPDRRIRVEELYHRALEIESESRADFLHDACGDDTDLYREVDSLLRLEPQAESFIEAPALEVAAQIAAADSQHLIGDRFASYKIISLLGRGGMGEVYLAEDTRLGRKLALKFLPPHFTNDAARLRRFEQEARATSALNHPNILTIYEIGAADGRRFIATEFIDGQTLRERINVGPLSLSEALNVAEQAASALASAHTEGIVHRDVKPENIMLRRDGIVKILDFGLAKLTEQPALEVDTSAGTLARVTAPGAVMGTASYMSPEQARGQDVDARTDIFSLGVVLYEMIAGRAPFEGDNPMEVISEVLKTEPAPLRSQSPDVPAELESIVSKALRKDRGERYQLMREMLHDLKSQKQDLEFEAKLKGVQRLASAGDKQEAATMPQTGEASTSAAAARATSSAEYIITGIKHHKLLAFLALIVMIAAAAGGALYLHAKNTEIAIDSIVVLPFANQNRDQDAEYLSDGLTESIINNLTQLPNLRVIARSSAFRYKGKEADPFGAAKELGVRAVVVGRVLQRGDSLTISAELVDARENKQLWGQQYNRKLADIFAVQEDIAKEISEKLRLKLTGAEKQQLARRPTENLKAFQYYMQGRSYAHRRTREDLLTAVRYCERAIEEDSNYALAYAGLAEAYSVLGVRGYIAPLEGQRKADEAARQALALDENLAEAHVAVSQVRVLFAPYDLPMVEHQLRRAIELSPSLATPHMYLGVSFARLGRFDESQEEYRKARELDPLAPIIARATAIPAFFRRDYARAYEELRQADEVGPAFIIPYEIGVYIQNGLFEAALAELEKAKRGTPTLQPRLNDPILIYSTGMVYAAQGKRAEALQIIKELEGMSGESLSQAHLIAKVYAALNEKELAFRWLERGLSAGAIGDFYKDEPVWDPIRSDQRFTELLRRMGITP